MTTWVGARVDEHQTAVRLPALIGGIGERNEVSDIFRYERPLLLLRGGEHV